MELNAACGKVTPGPSGSGGASGAGARQDNEDTDRASGGARSSFGGENAQGGSVEIGGMGGDVGEPMDPRCKNIGRNDPCTYPESFGGDIKPGECGVMAGAWYSLGDTDYVEWPIFETASDREGVELVDRAGKQWNSSEWLMPAPPFPAEGDWRALGVSDEFGVLAVREYDEEQDDLRLELFRSTGESWESTGVSVPAYQYYVGGHELDDVQFVQGVPRVVIVKIYSEDIDEYSTLIWDGEKFSSSRAPSSSSTDWIDFAHGAANAQLFLTAYFTPHDNKTLHFFWNTRDSWEGWGGSPNTTRPEAPNPIADHDGLRIYLDEENTAWASWPTEDTIEIRKWIGNKWIVVPVSEDVLADLPAEWRFHAFSRDEQVFLEMWGPCGWQGLSASDRDGGISNYDYGHDVEASVTVDTERVCVSYLNRLRCHDL